jgi:hypothetical protein
VVTAAADDVRLEIETELSDAEIQGPGGDGGILARVARDIERVMDSPPGDGTNDRQDLEAVLAALFIATSRERSRAKESRESASHTYEESLIDGLRGRARRLGAPDELLSVGAGKQTASITAPDAKNWSG